MFPATGSAAVEPAPDTQRHRVRVLQMCAVDFTVKQFLLPLADALQRAGYRVTIACTPGPYFQEIADAGFDIRSNPIARSKNVFRHAASLWRTYQFLKREQFDVVHVHTPIAALIGRIAAKLAGVPVKIYTAHGFYFHEGTTPMKKRAHVMLEKLGARCGDFIMTVSAEDEAAALELGIARPGHIETVYNGVDVARFDPVRFSLDDRAETRAKLGIAPEAQVIGIVGRMVREKGFFELFDAAAQVSQEFPNARFLVVGDTLPSDYDAAKNELIERMRMLRIADRVVFAGMVPDTAPMLAAMDIFCLPSYREGMPVSLLEAMAMQLPCIATNIRGCREEIVDGDSGLLIAPRDSAALAGALRDLLSNQEKAQSIGLAARQRVLDKFDLRKVLAHELEIYARLTGGMKIR